MSRSSHEADEFRVCGVRVDLNSIGSAHLLLDALALKAIGADVHLCNTFTLALAKRDPALRHVLNTANLNLPDGVPVLWAARVARQATPTRGVRGPELFSSALFDSWGAQHKHYLFGGAGEVIDRILRRATREGTRDRVVGHESPPFRELTEKDYMEAASRIRSSGANMVWVGLGTPKQDYAVARLKAYVPSVCIAVGAAFDFAAETKSEAPDFVRHTGLEWIFRLGTEPRRLWKRYLFGNTVFLLELATMAIRPRKDR